MGVIKCKMCGGDLVLVPDSTLAECEYCGRIQTVPVADNEKKLTLFARANRLRVACEFDKAAGILESIIPDFPEEAEAYWGLVLCKYGIEYVDDPATGKKVPTCHRSSFESVLDDSNFEQALENADVNAQKVYREEAKQIEIIRKGIIEISGMEEPYDIFICYKETGEDGDRTLDSVMAQDLYNALTEKGYRVFFSRITLQDKLGEAYEPYIFAALNSAKVMLAVGTCYEHYNAVWVKNEWSRYIKLCETDKRKHLIPCYKGMDPEDMPKEFRHLQGADLGKMGAVQDILFNMEKYIPLKKSTVIQEKIVVNNPEKNNRIEALLDRGNMALEDGEWKKADDFFEEVLNNDSKNARAYIGKTLVQEKCRSLNDLVQKRNEASQSVRIEKLVLEPYTEHIEEKACEYTVPNFVEVEAIRKLYIFDLRYESKVSCRKQQYKDEENWWASHKFLSRAEKFAEGEDASIIQNTKKELFTLFAERVKAAEQEEAEIVEQKRKAYADHIQKIDGRAQTLYRGGLARRELLYRSLLEEVKKASIPDELQKLAFQFDELGDYRDSQEMFQYCRNRAEEERIKWAAEAEKQRKALIEKAKREERMNGLKTLLGILAFIVVILILCLLVHNITPYVQYQLAKNYLKNGAYEKAIAAFEELGTYKDSKEQLLESQYQEAGSLLDSGKKAEAAFAYAKLDNYKDAMMISEKCWDSLVVRNTISVGRYHTVGLKSDGTVVAIGDNSYGECNVDEWSDIIDISADAVSTLGLKSDGTVVATGDNSNGQCDVSSWINIISVVLAGNHTVGLRKDGTVVATGNNEYGQCNCKSWGNIVDIAAGENHTVGLKADGTVIAVGDNINGQCNVNDWTDIVTIIAGKNYTVGLKDDGTVIAVGDNKNGQCNVRRWNNVIAVASAGDCTVGLTSNGTILIAGNLQYGEDISTWTDIIAISVGENHAVGLKSDGSLVAVGNNNYKQCNVSDWTDIKLP
ncbi:MAG: TIR domain-containing protein [Lachnospiraceae bacterium]